MGLGPKFGMPIRPNEIPIHEIMADVEYIVEHFEHDQQKDIVRTDASNALLRAKQKSGISPADRFLLDRFKKCNDFLHEHQELACVRSDKGGKTVLMYKQDYTDKSTAMLSDRTTYKVISDPTGSLQRKNNELVSLWHTKNLIDWSVKRKITTYNAVPPRMYFLPKFHKANLPLRPISSDINGPTNAMSKFAVGILNNLEKSRYHIRNSYDFREFITTQRFGTDERMVSFDVVSLFTNALMERIKTVLLQRWPEIQRYTKLPQQDFFKMIKLCTCNSYFKHGDKFYQQIYGTPMGSPISPISVEILLDALLDEVICKAETELNIKITVCKKYVDDIFLVLPEDKIDAVLKIFNGAERRIQFTLENERNEELPFLDMVVIRDTTSNTFLTRWYKKPIASGRLLNYHSLHPFGQRVATAIGLIDRVNRLSDARFNNENKTTVFEILVSNDYPKKLISRLWNRYHNSRSRGDTVNMSNNTGDATDQLATETNAKIYRGMLYVNGVSEQIRKSIRNVAPNIEVSMRNFHSVGTLFSSLKDRLPTMLQSNVVYHIPCLDCNRDYIGTTSQLLKVRVGQHKGTVRNIQPEKSALAHHAITHHHHFDFDNTTVIARNDCEWKRMFLEEVKIKSSSSCVNIKSKEANNVSNIYTKLLKMN